MRCTGPERTLRVELVYALPHAQDVITLELPEPACVEDALHASMICTRHPELREDALAVGIYGRAVTVGTPLRDGDRIEIYRPLLADPKQARRRRAARVR